MKLALQKFFLRFLQGKIYQRLLFPILAYAETPWGEQLSSLYFNDFNRVLRHGDLVFSQSNSLYSYLIPGEWTHVGIYNSSNGTIMEMLPRGFTYTQPRDFFSRSSAVRVSHCVDFDKKYTMRYVSRIEQHVFCKYDNRFSPDLSSLNCSDMAYVADKERRIKCSTADLLGLGIEYISPQGIENAENVVPKFTLYA